MTTTNEEIDLRTGTAWRDAEGIVHGVYKEKAETTLEDAHEWGRAFDTLCAGKKRPLLVVLGSAKLLERGARQYFASAECAKNLTATALVVGTPLSRAIGNFFLGLNKPLFPTRLFPDEPTATAWLREYL